MDESILKLLGQGVAASQVALAVGVSESRISQLVSEDKFASRLAEIRLGSLTKHNARDDRYDSLEDRVLTQLESSIPMVMDPMKQVLILTRLNNMKRRGASSSEHIPQKAQVISLQLPVNIINRFSVNGAQQVTTIDTPEGSQSMVTIQSGQIKKLAQDAAIKRDEIRNEKQSIRNPDPNSGERFGL